MPRRSRIDAPGALHHIIAPGINRGKIFSDKADYSDLLDRLGDQPNRVGETVKTDTTGCEPGRPTGAGADKIALISVSSGLSLII